MAALLLSMNLAVSASILLIVVPTTTTTGTTRASDVQQIAHIAHQDRTVLVATANTLLTILRQENVLATGTRTSITHMTIVMDAGRATVVSAESLTVIVMFARPTLHGQDGIVTAGLLLTGTDGVTRAIEDAGTVLGRLVTVVRAHTHSIIRQATGVGVSRDSTRIQPAIVKHVAHTN